MLHSLVVMFVYLIPRGICILYSLVVMFVHLIPRRICYIPW